MRKTPLLRFIPGIQTTSVRNANTASRILVCLLRRDASIMQIAMSNATNSRQDKTYAMMRRRFIAVPFCLALLATVTAAMITASVRAIPAVMRPGIHVCGELETYSCSAARPVVESVSPGTCGPNVRYMAKCPMEAPNALMMMNCRMRTLVMATIQGRLLKAPPNIHSIMPPPGPNRMGRIVIGHQSPARVMPNMCRYHSPILALSRVCRIHGGLPMIFPPAVRLRYRTQHSRS